MRIITIFILLIYASCKTSQYGVSLNTEIAGYKFQNVDTLVDIGCGDGFFDRMIAHAQPDMFFILEDLPYDQKNRNLSEHISKYFKNSLYTPEIEQHYKFIPGSPDSIPLLSLSAKMVLCRMTLHEFTNRDKMTSELIRILANEGTLLVMEREPKYAGELDSYCKNRYLTKTEIVDMLKPLILTEETAVYYDKDKVNIFRFSKTVVYIKKVMLWGKKKKMARC